MNFVAPVAARPVWEVGSVRRDCPSMTSGGQHRKPLALGDREADLGAMTTATKPRASRRQHPQLDPPGAPPRVAVAPGLQDRDHVVIRSDDDTDEDYEARCRVFAAALAFARKG